MVGRRRLHKQANNTRNAEAIKKSEVSPFGQGDHSEDEVPLI